VQEIPIKCYLSGQERIEKAAWLRSGEYALVRGEITDKGSVYAFQVQQLSRPERGDELDAYFQRMTKEQAGQGR
jgi:hypothetical protein